MLRSITKHLLFIFLSTSLFAKDGIEYFKYENATSSSLRIFGGAISAHVIQIDPKKIEIKAVKANDNGIGRETVLSLANRHGAIAAINGSFFGSDEIPSGILKINDWYTLSSKLRGCVGWSKGNTSFQFDRLSAFLECEYPDGSFLVDGLNRKRKSGETILFTPPFHRSTLTDLDGEELIIKKTAIKEIRKNKGSSFIPQKGHVLSIHKKHSHFAHFQQKGKIRFNMEICPQLYPSNPWHSCDFIVGGTPLLIYDGEKISDYSTENVSTSFLQTKRARTAIGLLPNGHILFVTVDEKTLWGGMTISELADLMQSLGCKYALNLDGGRSSNMVFEGNVINEPMGEKDGAFGPTSIRPVSDAIIAISKKSSS